MPISKNYLKAVNSLYGESTNSIALPTKRSSRYGQKKRVKKNIEQGLQIRLVSWLLNKGYSVFAIPNEGQRTRFGGQIAKQMGLRPGAADLFVAHPKRGFAGYFIEMKSPGEEPRENQVQFLDEMRRNGYKAEWFDDWEKARDSIKEYMQDGQL